MGQTNHPIVGLVRWQSRPDGTLKILDGWADKHIKVFDVPELNGIQTYGGKFSGKVQFYESAGAQLQAAWKKVKEHGLMSRVLFWDGSFVPRFMRGLTKPSEHTFGCAFDINAKWNGLGATPAPSGQVGSVRELVPFFEACGFEWGGGWKKRPDGMHFQIESLGVPKEVEAIPAVEIWLNERQQDVPAVFVDGKTWVGARRTTEKLGGKFDTYTPGADKVTLTLNGKTTTFTARQFGNFLYVPFSEVIPLYNVPFKFDKTALKVVITTK